MSSRKMRLEHIEELPGEMDTFVCIYDGEIA